MSSSLQPGDFSRPVAAATPGAAADPKEDGDMPLLVELKGTASEIRGAAAHRLSASYPKEDSPLVELPDPASELTTAATHRFPTSDPKAAGSMISAHVTVATPGDSAYAKLRGPRGGFSFSMDAMAELRGAGKLRPRLKRFLLFKRGSTTNLPDAAIASPSDSASKVAAPGASYTDGAGLSNSDAVSEPVTQQVDDYYLPATPLEKAIIDTGRYSTARTERECATNLPAATIAYPRDSASKGISNAAAELRGAAGKRLLAALAKASAFERADASSSSSRPLSPPPRSQATHVFVCHGTADLWPSTGPIVSPDSLPGSIVLALRSRGLTDKVSLSLFDPGDGPEFIEGDVVVFPSMMTYRSLDMNGLDDFVDTVILRGHPWNGEQQLLSSSVAFICRHDHGDQLRECSVFGPINLSFLKTEIQNQGLEGRVRCYACTAVFEMPGEIVLFVSDDGGCQCLQYCHVYPGHLRPMLSSLFGDATLDETTGPEFFEFWSFLLDIVHAGAEARMTIAVMPYWIDTEVQIVREVMLRTSLMELCNIWLSLRDAAAACQDGVITFDWMALARREINLVVKSIYRSARAVRKILKDRATLSVISPTGIEREILLGVEHVDLLVNFGEVLSYFVLTERGGGKAFPRGSDLLEPICGIRVRTEE